MEMIIRKPNENIGLNKDEIKILKLQQQAIKQATIYRTHSISAPAYPKSYIPSRLLFRYSLYALGFLSWFISWYFSY